MTLEKNLLVDKLDFITKPTHKEAQRHGTQRQSFQSIGRIV